MPRSTRSRASAVGIARSAKGQRRAATASSKRKKGAVGVQAAARRRNNTGTASRATRNAVASRFYGGH